MKILHIYNVSLPYRLTGYTIRSKYIVDIQKELGLEPIVATRYHAASDTLGDLDGEERVDNCTSKEYIEGVLYLRNVVSGFDYKMFQRMAKVFKSNRLFQYSYNRRFQKHIAQAIRSYSPDLIHVATPEENALLTIPVSKRFRIPVVYEVRGLEHESGVANGTINRSSSEYRKRSQDFLLAMKHADAVVTLSQAMKDEFMRGGIHSEKINIVPNGVDGSIFKPQERPKSLMEKAGIKSDEIVIGYIGSVRKLEGLQYLLQAGKMLLEKRLPIKLLIVGEGRDLDPLKALGRGLGLGPDVHFTGPIPHQQILNYYALIDIFVVPRIRSKVTELVTPLKPYEAMAMGKAIIVSDIQALREIVNEGKNGLLCVADNPEDLTQKCLMLIQNRDLRTQLGMCASKWVLKYHEWRTVVKSYQEIYDRAIRI